MTVGHQNALSRLKAADRRAAKWPRAVDLGGIPDGTYDLKVSAWNAKGALVARRDLLFTSNTRPTAPQMTVTPQLTTALDAPKFPTRVELPLTAGGCLPIRAPP